MKYDVYGIGNALVDKEFEIEDDFLKESDPRPTLHEGKHDFSNLQFL